MKVVQINATCGKGSTGKICVAISQLLNDKQIENYIFYSHGASDYANGIKFGNAPYYKFQALLGRTLGNNGFNSRLSTRKLISALEEIQPDIIHLHVLHSNDINLEMLFDYIKEKHIKVFWTFHDCWAFTGYCPHFAFLKCDKYKTVCDNCAYKKNTSWFFDRSGELQKRKFNAIKDTDLTIITPSQWLADCVKESVLRDFPVKVIHNGIDLDVFKPTESDFRKKHGLEEKFVVLGVAFGWGVRKGLDVFIELSKRLSEQYKIVLVGTDDSVDKQLPQSILSIHRTNDQKELAAIYSAADVFFNPTREENYPTVNMEAIACGTPVITFNTGGSPEIVNEMTGLVINADEIAPAETEIRRICEQRTFDRNVVAENAARFNAEITFAEYIQGYFCDGKQV